MKKLLVIGIALTLTACSSKKKANDDGAQETIMEHSDAATKSESKAEEKPVAQKAQTESKSIKTNCVMNKEKRQVEVRATPQGGCELFYTRGDNEKSVASSGFGTKYCEEVSERIVGNLSKAGFNCQ